MTSDGYPVGRVSQLAHVSVRTLHHYDEIGLLQPTQRTPAGHRRYSDADLQRLREILFYRERRPASPDFTPVVTFESDGDSNAVDRHLTLERDNNSEGRRGG